MSFDDININRHLSLLKNRKKQAANDAQLLMNRIALLQKEEDRSRKKIEQTKVRALEILALRDENERRLQSLIDANDKKKQFQRLLHERNVALEQESRKIRTEHIHEVHQKKKDEVNDVLQEKERMRRETMELQRIEFEKKRRRREMVREQEEMAKKKRDQERKEQERKTIQYYAMRAQEEEEEAKRAEQLVRDLERKEKEWIDRLRTVQETQEIAFVELENALQKELQEISLSRVIPGETASIRTPTTAMSSKSFGSSRRASSTPRAGKR